MLVMSVLMTVFIALGVESSLLDSPGMYYITGMVVGFALLDGLLCIKTRCHLHEIILRFQEETNDIR